MAAGCCRVHRYVIPACMFQYRKKEEVSLTVYIHELVHICLHKYADISLALLEKIN